MSEAQTLNDAQDSQAAPQPTAGALIKQAREASGLHIAALAVLLKVPVKKLEALESDRLDLLPDAVFVRALASSVCRTLRIDASMILSRLPLTGGPKLTYQGTGINAPFRSPGDGPGPSIWVRVSRPSIIAGTLLLLGTLILILLPNIKAGINYVGPKLTESKFKSAESEKASPPSTAVASPVVSLTSSGAMVSDSGVGPGMTAGLPNTDLPLVALGASSLKSTVQLTTTNELSAGSANTALAVSAAAQALNDVVMFSAKTESWVEATDANGKVVLRRVLAAGEVVGASGALPLKVIVGRADATLVEIRGKSFDVTAIAKDNVARFEVKQ